MKIVENCMQSKKVTKLQKELIRVIVVIRCVLFALIHVLLIGLLLIIL